MEVRLGTVRLSGIRQCALVTDHVAYACSSPHGEEICSWVSTSVWDRCLPSIVRKVGSYDM